MVYGRFVAWNQNWDKLKKDLEKIRGGKRRQVGRGTHTAWLKALTLAQLALVRSTGAERQGR